VALAVLAYASAVAWLYESPRAGKPLLWLVALAAIVGACLSMGAAAEPAPGNALAVAVPAGPVLTLLDWLDPLTGGLVLGLTIAAMFLGHWYLNTPTMQLAPLRRLVLLMAAAIGLRAIVCAVGLALMWLDAGPPDTAHALFLALRWAAGIFGALALTWMTWQTLQIPNTQSATGILYVAVIATFLGELTAQLLSRGIDFRL
jgi:hypothetical protein